MPIVAPTKSPGTWQAPFSFLQSRSLAWDLKSDLTRMVLTRAVLEVICQDPALNLKALSLSQAACLSFDKTHQLSVRVYLVPTQEIIIDFSTKHVVSIILKPTWNLIYSPLTKTVVYRRSFPDAAGNQNPILKHKP